MYCDRDYIGIWAIVFLLAALFVGCIVTDIKSGGKYADKCHSLGGDVIITADNDRLCHDGDKLINIYKQGDSK